jgi:hypothetical protein
MPPFDVVEVVAHGRIAKIYARRIFCGPCREHESEIFGDGMIDVHTCNLFDKHLEESVASGNAFRCDMCIEAEEAAMKLGKLKAWWLRFRRGNSPDPEESLGKAISEGRI